MMPINYEKRSRNLDEIYSFIDTTRVEAAKAAQLIFHNDMEAAIATIASIGAIAGTRILADSRVAATNVLINTEVASTRLLAEAEKQASKCGNQLLTEPRETVEMALLEIGKLSSEALHSSTKEAIAAIKRDAEQSIKILRETGDIAIREIRALADEVTEQTKQDAEWASEKLKEYRRSQPTADNATAQGEIVAKIIIQAAQEASLRLQDTIKDVLTRINAVTNEACAAVYKSAHQAEDKIQKAHELAIGRLSASLQSYILRDPILRGPA